MQLTPVLRAACAAVLMLAGAAAQDGPPKVEQGLPPRSTPADYQVQAQSGEFTLAAEFVQHSVPTPDGIFTNDDYIVVETAIFGPKGKRLALTPNDFQLRVNGKKQNLPSQPFLYALKALKSPEWEMEQAVTKAEKAKVDTGGDPNSGEKPSPPKMSMELRRAMEQKVQRASFPEGERPLPQAGLLYFEYHGKLNGLKSIELIYAGPAGKATIPLQP